MPVSKTRVREMHISLHVSDMEMIFTATTWGGGEGDLNTCKLEVRLRVTCILGMSFVTPGSDHRVTPQTSAYEWILSPWIFLATLDIPADCGPDTTVSLNFLVVFVNVFPSLHQCWSSMQLLFGEYSPLRSTREGCVFCSVWGTLC